MIMTTHSKAIASLVLTCLLASCNNGSSSFKRSTGIEDPYVSNYPSDGGYNPYPGQPGRIAGRETTYETPIAPVEADPYAFNAPSAPLSTSSSSSTAKTKTTAAAPKKGSSTKGKSSSGVAKKSTSPSTHTVTKGDTLYAIALKNKTTVAKIKAANGLSSDLIRPGQKLKLR